eukprot:gene5062-6973_t
MGLSALLDSPNWFYSGILQVANVLQIYGWYIVGAILLGWYLYIKLRPRIDQIKRELQKLPDVVPALSDQDDVMSVRAKQMERHMALVENAKKQMEENKRKQTLEPKKSQRQCTWGGSLEEMTIDHLRISQRHFLDEMVALLATVHRIEVLLDVEAEVNSGRQTAALMLYVEAIMMSQPESINLRGCWTDV